MMLDKTSETGERQALHKQGQQATSRARPRPHKQVPPEARLESDGRVCEGSSFASLKGSFTLPNTLILCALPAL